MSGALPPLQGQFYSPFADDISMEHWWNDDGLEEADVLGQKPVPEPVLSPQIPHGLSHHQPLCLRSQKPASKLLYCGTTLHAYSQFIVTEVVCIS